VPPENISRSLLVGARFALGAGLRVGVNPRAVNDRPYNGGTRRLAFVGDVPYMLSLSS